MFSTITVLYFIILAFTLQIEWRWLIIPEIFFILFSTLSSFIVSRITIKYLMTVSSGGLEQIIGAGLWSLTSGSTSIHTFLTWLIFLLSYCKLFIYLSGKKFFTKILKFVSIQLPVGGSNPCGIQDTPVLIIRSAHTHRAYTGSCYKQQFRFRLSRAHLSYIDILGALNYSHPFIIYN